MKRKLTAMSIARLTIMLIMTSFMTGGVFAQTLTQKQLTTEFDKILTQQFPAGETGCAALVAKNGQIIYRKAFGMADLELNVTMQPEMIFRIGSITKQFTAVAILQLMEQGKLSLQDEITKFIPDYPTQGHSITIEHLLTHTSGIKSYTSVPEYMKLMRNDLTPDELLEKISALPMEFAPGTKWNYSNSGYFLLGYIIEKVTGKTYQEYLQENFFTPLGMTGSCYGNESKIIKNRTRGYSPGGEGVVNAEYLSMTLPFSAGAIMSTVDDLYRWNRAVHSYKLVKKETLDMALTPYKLTDGKPTGYGYGWFLSELQGSPTIEHGGGINGYLTFAIYLPGEDVFVALFSNNNGKVPEFSALRMAALAIGKPLKTTAMTLDEAALKEYQGIYANEEGREATISLNEDRLSAARAGGSRRNMIPVEKNLFMIENSFTSIKFTRDAAGKIIEATFDDRGNVTAWKKTDKPMVEKKVVTVEESVLDRYIGEYEIQPGFTITFTRDGNRLFTQATGQQKIEIYPESETRFFLKVVDAQVDFVAGDDGKVNKIILHQGGQNIEGKRIKN